MLKVQHETHHAHRLHQHLLAHIVHQRPSILHDFARGIYTLHPGPEGDIIPTEIHGVDRLAVQSLISMPLQVAAHIILLIDLHIIHPHIEPLHFDCSARSTHRKRRQLFRHVVGLRLRNLGPGQQRVFLAKTLAHVHELRPLEHESPVGPVGLEMKSVHAELAVPELVLMDVGHQHLAPLQALLLLGVAL